MAMTAGTVTVADDGVVTKTAGSLAEALFDSLHDNHTADTGETIPTGAEGAPVKRGYATIATRFASAIVPWLATNVDVRITTGDAALQRDSSSVDTLGPLADRVLSGALE